MFRRLGIMKDEDDEGEVDGIGSLLMDGFDEKVLWKSSQRGCIL